MQQMAHDLLSAVRSATTSAGQPIWILNTANTAYVCGIDKYGMLQHVYWGPRLRADGDYGEPQPASPRFPHERNEGISQEEYPAWGDIKYCEPCLKATFADGVRAVVLQFKQATINPDPPVTAFAPELVQASKFRTAPSSANDQANATPVLVLTLADACYGLEVDLCYRVWAAYDLIERWSVLRNTGDQPIRLEQTLSAMWNLPLHETYRLRTLGGRWGGETRIGESVLPIGKHVIESRRGLTSALANPWFALDRNAAASEITGDVWFGALAYSGSWKIVVESNAHGQTQLAGGINDFDSAWKLAPNETFATPAFIGGFSDCGFGLASRRLHRYAREVVMPRATAAEMMPVLYNSWYVTEFDVNFANQAAAAEIAAELGVELFVMDDGWFGVRDDDTSGLGDWFVDTRKFPQGLQPLINHVNKLGMDFGIWVEPEMVNQQSQLYAAHPDWVYHFPNRPRSEARNQLVLNFGRADVQEYVLDALHKLLADHNIKFVKWDMNRSFSEPGWPDAEQGRDQEVWIRHVQGLYRIFAELRDRHPHVLFESCSSGGGRIDLGVLRYVDDFWLSDNVDPLDNIFMYEGYSQVYPAKAKMMWVNDTFDFTQREASLDFRFHQAMTGALGLGANLTKWSREEIGRAQEHIATYKSIRETVQHGDLYRLASMREGDWAAFEYVAADGREAVVFVFLQAARFGPSRRSFRLQGLDPEAMYQVEGEPQVYSGVALMARGIMVEMRGDLQSRLLRILRV